MYLTICKPCEEGRHDQCMIGQSPPPGVFGGWKCNCQNIAHHPNHGYEGPELKLGVEVTSRDRWRQIQAVLGTVQDGIPGSKDESALNVLRTSAVREYQASKATKPNNIPKDDDASLRAFYGPPGETHLTTFDLPYPMRIAWDTNTVVKRATCHEACKEDLISILENIFTQYGSLEAVKRARMDLYGGIYNYRKMRGGTSWSRHAWGIAIDLDPDQNGLNTPWPEEATMPVSIIQIFERHGWKSYARSIGRDAMHFQRTQ